MSLLLDVCWDRIVSGGKVSHWGRLLGRRGSYLILNITMGYSVRHFLSVYDLGIIPFFSGTLRYNICNRHFYETVPVGDECTG